MEMIRTFAVLSDGKVIGTHFGEGAEGFIEIAECVAGGGEPVNRRPGVITLSQKFIDIADDQEMPQFDLRVFAGHPFLTDWFYRLREIEAAL